MDTKSSRKTVTLNTYAESRDLLLKFFRMSGADVPYILKDRNKPYCKTFNFYKKDTKFNIEWKSK